jgi:hypothetical protein
MTLIVLQRNLKNRALHWILQTKKKFTQGENFLVIARLDWAMTII